MPLVYLSYLITDTYNPSVSMMQLSMKIYTLQKIRYKTILCFKKGNHEVTRAGQSV